MHLENSTTFADKYLASHQEISEEFSSIVAAENVKISKIN